MSTPRSSNIKPENNDFDLALSHRERRWSLMLVDLLAINGGLLLSLYFREDYHLTGALMADNPMWFLLLTGLWIFVSQLFQLYDVQKAVKFDTTLISVVSAGLTTLFIYNFIPYLPPALPPSRLPFFMTVLFPVAFLLVGRGVYALIFAQDTFRKRLLIVGAGWAGKTIMQAIQSHGLSFYKPVGYIDDDPQKQGQVVQLEKPRKPSRRGADEPLRILGTTEDLSAIIRDLNISTVVLAVTYNTSGELLGRLTNSLQQGVEIIPMPVLYERLTGKVPVEHVGDHWSVTMPLDHPGTKTSRQISQRAFDLFWASLGTVFLALAFPFIALAIYLDSPGPILYRQERLGRHGQPYQMLKFRSMIHNAEQGQAVWAREGDPRITRVGRILRKTHVDEFPQFINVLRGEMSVVGPRPERPEIIEQLETEIPFYKVRLAVKPGMAGWGLIHLGYGSSVQEALEKLQYDLYYIKHQNLMMDILILGRTFVDALTFRGI